MYTTHLAKLRPDDVLRRSQKRRRTSVFGPSISECYIIKMASTAQQVKNTKGRNMNYMP